jgi:hypothetical protein
LAFGATFSIIYVIAHTDPKHLKQRAVWLRWKYNRKGKEGNKLKISKGEGVGERKEYERAGGRERIEECGRKERI